MGVRRGGGGAAVRAPADEVRGDSQQLIRMNAHIQTVPNFPCLIDASAQKPSFKTVN